MQKYTYKKVNIKSKRIRYTLKYKVYYVHSSIKLKYKVTSSKSNSVYIRGTIGFCIYLKREILFFEL